MTKVRAVAVCLLAALVALSGCAGLAPESAAPPKPDVTYQPFAVGIDGPDSLEAGQTATVTVRATLKRDQPDFLVPSDSSEAVENVTVTLGDATWVRGSAARHRARLRPGETATWSFPVCAATAEDISLSATVEGSLVTGTDGRPNGRGWSRSHAERTISLDGTGENSTADGRIDGTCGGDSNSAS